MASAVNSPDRGIGDPGARCRGRLQLSATSLIRRSASGAANFDIPAGDQATIRMQPPKRLVELVRERRRAIGKVVARLETIPGQTVSAPTVKRLLTVQARRSKR